MDLCGFKPDGVEEIVKGMCNALVECVELGKALLLDFLICWKGSQQASREGSINSFEEFQEDQAYAVASGQQPVASGMGNFLYETFRS